MGAKISLANKTETNTKGCIQSPLLTPNNGIKITRTISVPPSEEANPWSTLRSLKQSPEISPVKFNLSRPSSYVSVSGNHFHSGERKMSTVSNISNGSQTHSRRFSILSRKQKTSEAIQNPSETVGQSPRSTVRKMLGNGSIYQDLLNFENRQSSQNYSEMQSPSSLPRQFLSEIQSPSSQSKDNSLERQSPVPGQTLSERRRSFSMRIGKNSSESELPSRQSKHSSTESQSSSSRSREDSSESQSTNSRSRQNSSESQSPSSRPRQDSSESQSTNSRSRQNSSESQSPSSRPRQNSLENQSPSNLSQSIMKAFANGSINQKIDLEQRFINKQKVSFSERCTRSLTNSPELFRKDMSNTRSFVTNSTHSPKLGGRRADIINSDRRAISSCSSEAMNPKYERSNTAPTGHKRVEMSSPAHRSLARAMTLRGVSSEPKEKQNYWSRNNSSKRRLSKKARVKVDFLEDIKATRLVLLYSRYNLTEKLPLIVHLNPVFQLDEHLKSTVSYDLVVKLKRLNEGLVLHTGRLFEADVEFSESTVKISCSNTTGDKREYRIIRGHAWTGKTTDITITDTAFTLYGYFYTPDGKTLGYLEFQLVLNPINIPAAEFLVDKTVKTENTKPEVAHGSFIIKDKGLIVLKNVYEWEATVLPQTKETLLAYSKKNFSILMPYFNTTSDWPVNGNKS